LLVLFLTLKTSPTIFLVHIYQIPDLTIQEFVRFKLHPPPLKESTGVIELSHDAFNTDLAYIQDGYLQWIQYPSYIIFRQFLNKPLPFNSQSVAVGASWLPLAVMRIWSLWLRVTVVQDAWATAIQWVMKISAPNHPMLTVTINPYPEGIKWTAALKSFGADYGISILLRILSSEWLAGNNIDILTELLRKEAAFSSISIAFLGRYQIMHIEGLQLAFAKNPLDGSIASKQATVVCQMGEDLLQGNTRYFGGIVNLDRVHWISFLIDGQWQCILIGDSLVDPNRSGLLVAKSILGFFQPSTGGLSRYLISSDSWALTLHAKNSRSTLKWIWTHVEFLHTICCDISLILITHHYCWLSQQWAPASV
jgi:hypothetical protein